MRTYLSWRGYALRMLLAVTLVAGVVQMTSAPGAVAQRPAPAGTPSVVNGDFSAGDTAFGTDYTSVTDQPGPDAMHPEGTYAVAPDPSAYHSDFAPLGDHTSGNGNMLIVNGATAEAPETVWSETVTSVSPSTNYVFSLWVASVASDPASLDLSVNGHSIGVYPAPSATLSWTHIVAPWQSGASTQADLSIADDNIDAPGNDFVIDDIAFASTLPGNTSWPHAAVIGANSDTADQAISVPGENLWYAVPIQPGSQLQITATGMTNNLDLTVFTDIGQVFSGLTNLRDLTQVSAEQSSTSSAPHYFSPHYFSPHYFSPHYFSPTEAPINAFTPDAFSPSAVTASTLPPSTFTSTALAQGTFNPNDATLTAFDQSMFDNIDQATLTDAFSGAQDRALLAVSANDGTADESITAQTWNNTGRYYIRMSGRNGATSPFELKVTTSGGPCNNVTLDDFSGDGTIRGTPGPSTVILTDPGRMGAGASAPDVTALNTAVNTFSNQVNGVVVNLDNSDRVNALNNQADSHAACPYAKNMVAQAIRDIVNSYRGPNLKYVVIVGPDRVIPFFRYADAAGLAPESDFTPPVADTSPSQASLRNDEYLSQDAYGAEFDMTIQGRTFPLTDLAVGRLVETPAEITATLNHYTSGTTPPLIQANSTLTTGYDFLADGANAVHDQFTAGNPGGRNDALITNQGVPPSQTTVNNTPDPNHSWTATDLSHALFGQRHDVTFLAGHFSHSGALAADYTTALFASDVAHSTANFTDSLVFSAGCHSGYNLVDQDGITGLTDDLDWAEAFAQKGATLVAGAGYQYGDSDFVAYSEKLYTLFAHDLREGSQVAVGNALAQAKQDYLTSLTDVDGIDQKSLLESTLYGLPMQNISFSNPVASPTQSSYPINPTAVPANTPGAVLELQTAPLAISPSLTTITVNLASANGSVTTHYLSGPGGKTVVSEDAPTLPLVQVDASANGEVLRGMLFTGGTYTDVSNITPLTGSATTEQSAANAPFFTSAFYPNRMATANYFGRLTGGNQTIVNATPVQYRSDAPGSLTDTQRTYSDIHYDLYYSHNRDKYGSAVPALSAAPSITNVNSGTASDGKMFVSASVVGDPAAGIQRVVATFTGKPGSSLDGAWQSVDLTQDTDDSTLWHGELPQGCIAAECRFMIQAVNGVGEVGIDDNYGMYYVGQVVAGQLPDTTSTTLRLDAGIPTSRTYGSSLPVGAVLQDSSGNPVSGVAVTFSLGGGSGVISSTDSQGHATASLPVTVDPGTYSLTATFAGDNNLATSTSDSVNVSVGKQSTVLTLSRSTSDGSFVAILRDASGAPLNAQTVTLVAANGSGATLAATARLTGSNGQAVFPVSAAPQGTQSLVAWFGDANTPAVGGTSDQSVTDLAASRSLAVRPPTLAVTDSANKALFGKPVSFKISATGTSAGSTAPQGTVTLLVDGSPVYKTALQNGSATITTAVLFPVSATLTRQITVSYSGDGNFLPATSAPLTHTIGCTVYTGTQKGSLSFSKAGASYCVVNATVNGSITVSGGSAAAVVNTTTVNSTINANGAGVVMICNSKAGGGLSVTNAIKGAGVIVGGPSDSLCPSNTASGSLTIQNDLSGVQALNNKVLNTVCKNVAAVNGWPYPGDISQVTGCKLPS